MAKILELNDILHVFGETPNEEPLLQYKKTTEISTDQEATASNGLYRKYKGSYWKRQPGASITVDTALSTTSTNPVQNRVIRAAFDNYLTASTAQASYEPKITKNTAFNRNFGTTTGTVADAKWVLDKIAELGNASFMGSATPTTNPGTVSQPAFWLTTTPGTYTNLGGVTVTGMFAVIAFDGTVWEVSETELPIEDGSIVPEKTNFLQAGKNKYNKQHPDNKDGYSINVLNGAEFALANYSISHYIPVKPNTAYYPTFKHRVVFYNEAKSYISGIDENRASQGFTTPAGAAYIRALSTIGGKATFQVEEGAAFTFYEEYKYVLGGLDGTKVEALNFPEIDVKVTDLAFIRVGKNKFNILNAENVDDYYVQGATGVLATNSAYTASHFIPIEPGKTYYPSYKHQMAWYGAGKAYISGEQTTRTNQQVTAPAGAAFARFTILKSSKATFQVEEGTQQTAFEPFRYLIGAESGVKVYPENLPPGIEADQFLLFLPKEVCIAVGRTVELYNSQVSWCGNIANYHFHWTGAGKSMKRKWSMTGVNVGQHALTLTVYDNNMNQVAMGTTTVRVVANNITAPFTVCPIGDSLSNTKPWPAEVTALSGGAVTFVGTRGGGTHEGRSGARSEYYLGNNSYTYDATGITGNDGRTQNLNPFWNPNTGDVDFSYYKTNYNQNPGRLLIWLGTNGITVDPVFNAGNIKTFIDKIRATGGGTIKIYVVHTLFRGNQDGIGKQMGSDGYVASVAWKLEEDRKVFNLQVELHRLLKDYANVFLVPVSTCHDSEFNFGAVETPVNPRAAQVEYLPVEATHPQLQGYMQIADVIFSSLAANQ